MKRFRFLAVGLLVAASHAAMASGSANVSGSMNDFPLRTLPVLVNVDATGKITNASPAMQLPPAIQRLLLTNLGEMVSGPAHSKGKAISSQCIINVALQASPRDDGNFDAGFAYLSSQPVPIGRWHWVNLDGRRLMLASDDAPRHMYPEHSNFNNGGMFNGPSGVYNSPAMPTMSQPAASSSPSSAGHSR